MQRFTRALILGAAMALVACGGKADAPKKTPDQPTAEAGKTTSEREPTADPIKDPIKDPGDQPQDHKVIAGELMPVDKPVKVVAEPSTAGTRGGDPTVTLLEAGADPKAPIRFALTAGSRQTSSLTMTMAMGMKIGDNAVPKMNLPPMKMTLSAEIKDVNKAGDATYAFKVDSVEVIDDGKAMKMVVDAMKKELNSIKGLNGSATITNRGYTKDAKLDMSSVNPQLKQMMDGFQQSLNQMSVPLPGEPVGIGAKWTVVQSIDQSGMKVDQTATFELVKVEGSKVVANVTLKQSAGEQDVKAPGMPAGATAKLLSLTGAGSGTTTIDLTQVMPSASQAKVSSSVKMNVSAMGQQQAMEMDMDIDMVMGQ